MVFPMVFQLVYKPSKDFIISEVSAESFDVLLYAASLRAEADRWGICTICNDEGKSLADVMVTAAGTKVYKPTKAVA